MASLNAVAGLLREPLGTPWFQDEQAPRNPFRLKAGTTRASIWQATQDATLYLASGRGDFPVDMLRRDHGFVLTPIPHPRHPNYKSTYSVVIGLEKPWTPLYDRWTSFGWRVSQMPLDNAESLKSRALAWRGTCHRCNTECGGYTMSYFNHDLICSVCDERERAHPDFAMAEASDRFAIKQGNYNFPGIGWPGVHGGAA
jgi:hypothetical protein